MPTQAERRSATSGAILSAGRELFGAQGFARVTIDEVAAVACVTKGAVYHHFGSKEALFSAVLLAEQQRLATATAPGSGGDAVELLASAVHGYLLAVSAKVTRQIVLVDGPAVLGWARWREIDERVFGQSVRQAVALIRGIPDQAEEVEPFTTLVMGAITEAAMVCATSPDPEGAARRLSDAFRSFLAGLTSSGFARRH